jgi:hypothetical protein
LTISNIRQWIQNNSEAITTTDPEWHGSINLFKSQLQIGWRLLTRGFLSSQWLTFLLQTLHNDKWRTKHNNISEFDDTRERYKWKMASHLERFQQEADQQQRRSSILSLASEYSGSRTRS